MSSLGQRVRDTISDHPETVVLAFSVCVLFLAITIFLWARRAARMQTTIEELTASRNVLTQLAHRPGAAAADRQATPASRTVYSVGRRPVTPAPAPPAVARRAVAA